MNTSTRRLRRTVLAVTAVVALLALGACSGAGDSDGGGTSDSMAGPEAAADREVVQTDGLKSGAFDAAAAANPDAPDTLAQQRAVISTGEVSLRSDDVAAARFDVQRVVDIHGGEITEENTETNDAGTVNRSRLVIRVPVAEFSDTMAELKKVADFESASSSSEDVTTQVIDTQVRIRAQEKSVERIEILLARAQSIRDIVAIEAQLTRRQADLDSLKQQMAWLDDQTSMSTITVHLRQTPPPKADPADDTGFLAGLAAGWDGMKTFVTGAATLVGALLPFAVLLTLVGVPLWFLLRRFLRSRPHPAEADPVPAEG